MFEGMYQTIKYIKIQTLIRKMRPTIKNNLTTEKEEEGTKASNYKNGSQYTGSNVLRNVCS
jgi:hypothetical protein